MGRGRLHGRTIDGWQVELFAVDLPADAWPASEAISAYYGRNALENRFAQEDHEHGLDRIVSYHLPGQELATLVGLWVWNLRLVRGFQLEPPPVEEPVQRLRQPVADERVPAAWPRDPAIVRMLAELDWPALLAKQRAAWSFNPETGELTCEEGRALTLTTVRPQQRNRTTTGMIFRRPVAGCTDCSTRPGCLSSDRPQATKHAEFSIPTGRAGPLRERLALTRGKTTPLAQIAPITVRPGPCAVHEALFLPAEARKTFREVLRDTTIRVAVHIPRQPRRPRLVAVDLGDRQRRRLTWKQNVARNALPADAQIAIDVAAPASVHALLGGAHCLRAQAEGA